MNTLNDNNFKEQIKNKTVVIDFYATWCGPCKMIMPKFEELSNKYKNYTFYKANVDECSKICQDFNIINVPMFFILDNEKVIFKGDFNQLNTYLGGK